MGVDGIVVLGDARLKETSVMASGVRLCTAAHLLAFKVKIMKWPEYKEYLISFTMEDNQDLTLVFTEEEFKEFVELLNKAVAYEVV